MSSFTPVLGISNAIVDVLAHVNDETLINLEAPKGSMTLIDEARAVQVYARMGQTTEMSGGSVANTIAGLAKLGGSASYIGRVADDQLGQIFDHDMKAAGVDIRLPPTSKGSPTARCYVLITPDGQRTMQTYLGACLELDSDDVTAATIGEPGIIMLEGYIWDTPHGEGAIANAMRAGEKSGVDVALTLSDAECVRRHRASYLDSIERQVAIVFADEEEAVNLFGGATLEATLDRAAQTGALFVITRSEKGSVLVKGEQRLWQDAYPVSAVIDSTGAGDAYAAGFLYGYTAGKSLAESADLGSRCGAAVIQQLGARVERSFLFQE